MAFIYNISVQTIINYNFQHSGLNTHTNLCGSSPEYFYLMSTFVRYCKYTIHLKLLAYSLTVSTYYINISQWRIINQKCINPILQRVRRIPKYYSFPDIFIRMCLVCVVVCSSTWKYRLVICIFPYLVVRVLHIPCSSDSCRHACRVYSVQLWYSGGWHYK